MENEIINSIPVLTFSLFSNTPRLKCYAFTKDNGNLSLNHGDSRSTANRKKILSAFSFDRFYEVNQVHGNEICEWDNLHDSDGIYTDRLMTPLFIRMADCQAAVFYDEEKSVLALAHAGWRGLEMGIYTKTIERLIKRYGSDPKNIKVGIAPSISGNCFEFKENAPGFMHAHHIGNAHYDLKSFARHELLNAGILEQNIEIAPECTFQDERFYSYRRDKTLRRQGLLAWLCN